MGKFLVLAATMLLAAVAKPQDSCRFMNNRIYLGVSAISLARNDFDHTVYIDPHLRIKQNNWLAYNCEYGYFTKNDSYIHAPTSLTINYWKINPAFRLTHGKNYLLELGPVFGYHSYLLNQFVSLTDLFGQTLRHTDVKNVKTIVVGADLGHFIVYNRFFARYGLQIGTLMDNKLPSTQNLVPGYGLKDYRGPYVVFDFVIGINIFYNKKCPAIPTLHYEYR